jgi:peptidyl-prolyl cis-trans isomerase B (cyclophilin B)
MKKKLFLASLALIIILGAIAYMAYGYYHKQTLKVENPVVTMEIADYGTIKIELYPEMAPNTVRNIIKLINEEYYNGLTFHKVEENLIQRWG